MRIKYLADTDTLYTLVHLGTPCTLNCAKGRWPTNVIESAFATIRRRSERAKGCVSLDSMLSMIFKVGMSAQLSWRRLKGFEFLAKVVAGVKFQDGLEQPSSQVQTASRKREHDHRRVAA
jgi:hypothetical protein